MIYEKFIVGQQTYQRPKPQFLSINPEAMNPYGRSEYRIVKCNKVYRKNRTPIYSFTALAHNNQIKCIKVFGSQQTIEVFKQVKYCLTVGNPAVVRFSYLFIMTYTLPRAMGISVYSDSCEFVDKVPEAIADLPYYTASVTEEKNID